MSMGEKTQLPQVRDNGANWPVGYSGRPLAVRYLTKEDGINQVSSHLSLLRTNLWKNTKTLPLVVSFKINKT